MKLGADHYGLLRADKMVIYFAFKDDLNEFASRLLVQIAGIPAHGVPFSTQIDSDGLLSSAADPPQDQTYLGFFPDNSWRIWICNRIAQAIHAARNANLRSMEPWEYAISKLCLAGIDTECWTWRDELDESHVPR
ncbi:hypothetical protein AA309_28675 [Microvirga vignae]|uniref:Uncharacterized protein n=2 Tax=Microvirga vignae TaxID=1225564 RepID=A0A0H1R468_9HYPH|nr:hypothetical protein AA309_28675 [Microvirga vignae]